MYDQSQKNIFVALENGTQVTVLLWAISQPKGYC